MDALDATVAEIYKLFVEETRTIYYYDTVGRRFT